MKAVLYQDCSIANESVENLIKKHAPDCVRCGSFATPQDYFDGIAFIAFLIEYLSTHFIDIETSWQCASLSVSESGNSLYRKRFLVKCQAITEYCKKITEIANNVESWLLQLPRGRFDNAGKYVCDANPTDMVNSGVDEVERILMKYNGNSPKLQESCSKFDALVGSYNRVVERFNNAYTEEKFHLDLARESRARELLDSRDRIPKA